MDDSDEKDYTNVLFKKICADLSNPCHPCSEKLCLHGKQKALSIEEMLRAFVIVK